MFGWADGEISHFSLAALLDMAKGVCCEQDIFLTASFLSRSVELGNAMTKLVHAMTKLVRSTIPAPCPLWLPEPGRVSTHLTTLSTSLLRNVSGLPSLLTSIIHHAESKTKEIVQHEDLLLLLVASLSWASQLQSVINDPRPPPSMTRLFLALKGMEREKDQSQETKTWLVRPDLSWTWG